MSSKTTNSTSTLNYATNTRATIEVHAIPELSFNCTTFNVPSMATSSPKQPTPFTDIPLRGDTLVYAPLDISFIVTENLENFKLAVAWMEGFTAPDTPEQWINKKVEYSDATIYMYNSHNNLQVEVLFTGLTPIFISGLRFDTTAESAVELICDVTFEYQNYRVVGVTKRTDNT